MQDKEFDKLFSSKLNEFEVEPSKSVWPGINQKLGEKRHKNLVPLLSIAAGIIVLIGAGILFMIHGENPIKPVKHQVVNNQPAEIAPVSKKDRPVTESPKTTVLALNTKVKQAQVVKPKMSGLYYKQVIPVRQPVAVQPPQHVLAAVSVKDEGTIQPATADTAIKLADLPVVKTDKPVAQMVVVNDNDKPVDNQPAKKHRIHTFGDMLNVVIAAVDKRKDKVIEFSNTDGDESSITAINLGIIKIKKEN